MKKRNQSLRLLTCLLPCSLLLSSLPLRAQDVDLSDSEVQTIDPAPADSTDAAALTTDPEPADPPADQEQPDYAAQDNPELNGPASDLEENPSKDAPEQAVDGSDQSVKDPESLDEESGITNPESEQERTETDSEDAQTDETEESNVQDEENEPGILAVIVQIKDETTEYRFGDGTAYASAKEALIAAVRSAVSNSGAQVTLKTDIDLGSDQLRINSPAILILNGSGYSITSSSLDYGTIRVEGGRIRLQNLYIRNTAGSGDGAVALYTNKATVDLYSVNADALSRQGTGMVLNNGSGFSNASCFSGGYRGAQISWSDFNSFGDMFYAGNGGRALDVSYSSSVELSSAHVEASSGNGSTSYGAIVSQSTMISRVSSFKGGYGIHAFSGSRLDLTDSNVTGTTTFGLGLQTGSAAVMYGGSASSDRYYAVYNSSSSFEGSSFSAYGVGGYAQDGTAEGTLHNVNIGASNGYGANCDGGSLQITGNSQIQGSTYGLYVGQTGSLDCGGGSFSGGTCALQVDPQASGSVSLSGGTFQATTSETLSIRCAGRTLESLMTPGFSLYQIREAQDLQAQELIPVDTSKERQTETVIVAPEVDLSYALSDQSKYIGEESSISVQTDLPENTSTVWLLENTETGETERKISDSLHLDLSDMNTVGSWNVTAAIRLGSGYLRTNTAVLRVMPHWIESLEPVIDQVKAPEPMRALSRTLESIDGLEDLQIAWNTEADKADFNTGYQAEITFRIKDGWQLRVLPTMLKGWITEKNGSQITMKRTYSKTRKERLSVDTSPQDITLTDFYPSASSLEINGLIPSFATYIRESDGSTGSLYFFYAKTPLPETPEQKTTVEWSVYQNELDLDDFELSIPREGTITITNPPAIEVHHEGWHSWVDFPFAPIDVTTGWRVDPRVSGVIEYYLIEEGKEPVPIPRGLLSVSKAGIYTIEMRTPAQGKYAAGSARGTVEVRRIDGSDQIEASMEGWTYGQQPAELNLKSEAYDITTASVRYVCLDGDPDQDVILSSTSPAGHYAAMIAFPQNEIYTSCEKTVAFTIAKAQREWTPQTETRLDVLETIDLEGGFSGDGQVRITSSNPNVLEITEDGKLKGMALGTATVTVSFFGSNNYEDASESFSVKVGWQDVEWSGVAETISRTYGDENFTLTPQCSSSSEIRVSIIGEAIARDGDGSFSVVKAGEAVIVFSTDRTEDHYRSELRVPVTVSKKQVTVRADHKTRIYGDPTPELSWSAEGLVHEDSLRKIVLDTDGRTDVGTSIITVSVDESANPNYDIISEQGTLQIEPRPIALSWSSLDLVYNGKLQGPTLEYGNVIDGDTVHVVCSGAAIHAGEGYTMRAEELDNSNYRLPETGLETTFSILPKEIIATAPTLHKVYGDSDPVLAPTVSGLVEGDQSGTIRTVRQEGEHVGEYILSVVAENLNPDYVLRPVEGKLTIAPREVLIAWDETPLIYNGSEQAPAASVEGLLEQDECEAVVSGAMKNAGTGYQATVSSLSNPNYALSKTASLVRAFDILPKEATVTVVNQTKVYGEPDPQLSWRATGLIDGESLENISIQRDEGEETGSYSITASSDQASNPNYSLTFTDGTLTISPREVSLSWSQDRLVYNGNEQVPSAVVENLLDGDECDVNVSGAQVHAGSGYMARIESLSSSNYRLPQSGLEKAFSIEPKELEVRALAAEKVYGEPDPDLQAELSGLVEGDLPGTIQILRDEGEDVGEYDLNIIVENLNPDYTLRPVEGKLTIAPRKIQIVWDETPLIYNGSEQAPSASVEGLLEQDECGVVVSGAMKDAGSGYRASAFALSSPNYALSETASLVRAFEILPKEATVTAENQTKVYGDPDPQLIWKADGLVEGETLEDISISRRDGEHTGHYEILVEGESSSNPNYSLNYVNGELAILPRTVRVSWSDDKLVYNGKEQLPAAILNGLIDGDECIANLSGARIHAGEGYRARIESLSSPDYVLEDFADAETTFSIEPKPALVKADSLSKVYGQPDPDLSWAAEGLADKDVLSGISLIRKDGEHVGRYEITPSADRQANPDYDLTFEQGSLTIDPAALTIRISPAQKRFGDLDPAFESQIDGWLEKEEPKVELTREEGEDAGEYAISASIPSLSRDYDLHVEPANLTISPRSIEDFSVLLKDLLRENGQTLEQTLEDLVYTDASGKEHPVAVTVSGHQASQGGAYVLTINGTGNFAGEIRQSYVVLPKSGPVFERSPDGQAKIGKGALDLTFTQDSTLPEASLSSTHEDLLNLLADQDRIHPMDLAAIADGASKSISLSLKDRSKDAPSGVAEALKKQTADLRSPLFSLSLSHPFTEQAAVGSEGKVSMTMAIPKNMPLKEGSLRLVSYIDGKVTQVEYKVTPDGTTILFDIEPDTICQLQYSRKKIPGSSNGNSPTSNKPGSSTTMGSTNKPGSTSGANSSVSNGNSNKPTSSSGVKTGIHVMPNIASGLSSFGALWICLKKMRGKKDSKD